jgi:hypothetical protein
LAVPEPTIKTEITLIGLESAKPLVWKKKSGYLAIWLPQLSRLSKSLRSKEAWTLKMTNLENIENFL